MWFKPLLNPLPHRDAFKRFTPFANGNMFRYDPALVDLASNLFDESLFILLIFIVGGAQHEHS